MWHIILSCENVYLGWFYLKYTKKRYTFHSCELFLWIIYNTELQLYVWCARLFVHIHFGSVFFFFFWYPLLLNLYGGDAFDNNFYSNYVEQQWFSYHSVYNILASVVVVDLCLCDIFPSICNSITFLIALWKTMNCWNDFSYVFVFYLDFCFEIFFFCTKPVIIYYLKQNRQTTKQSLNNRYFRIRNAMRYIN